MLLCSVVHSPGSFTGIAVHFLLLEAAPDFKTLTLLLHSLVSLHVPPPGLPLPLMILRVTTNLLSSTIKSALEVVPDLIRWLRSWVYYKPTRTLLLERGLKFCSTGWVSKFPSPESWSKLSFDSRHSSNLEDTDKEAVLCQTLFPRNDLNISNVFAQSPTKQDVVNLGPMVTWRIRYQMAVPFLEQCVAYDKVMGHSEVKEPNTLVISLTISEATMDFLKPSCICKPFRE